MSRFDRRVRSAICMPARSLCRRSSLGAMSLMQPGPGATCIINSLHRERLCHGGSEDICLMRTRASARSQAVFSRGVRCICTVDLSRAAAHASEGTLR